MVVTFLNESLQICIYSILDTPLTVVFGMVTETVGRASEKVLNAYRFTNEG